MLGIKTAADQWFVHLARALHYQSPCHSLSTSQGYRRLGDMLGQIEYGGVYTLLAAYHLSHFCR
ncbi:DUF2384 domain-containing protein [Pseudomonas fluorescens]|nr:DUF2384 domain-containing protein [Pseudomonas fluorescens]